MITTWDESYRQTRFDLADFVLYYSGIDEYLVRLHICFLMQYIITFLSWVVSYLWSSTPAQGPCKRS